MSCVVIFDSISIALNNCNFKCKSIDSQRLLMALLPVWPDVLETVMLYSSLQVIPYLLMQSLQHPRRPLYIYHSFIRQEDRQLFSPTTPAIFLTFFMRYPANYAPNRKPSLIANSFMIGQSALPNCKTKSFWSKTNTRLFVISLV